MNFKTFCLSALAFIAAVNAAPVQKRSASIDSIKKACTHGNSELYVKMNDDEASYACLHKYNEKKFNNVATPNNSACYYYGDDVLCVDRRYTNIKECIKSEKDFDYRNCSYDILSLLGNGNEEALTYKLRSYPKNERIFINALQDQKQCRERNGIVLTYKSIYQYICLYPENVSHSLKDKHCVKVDGKINCVYEDNTIIDTCNKHSEGYNHEVCMQILSEYAKANGVTVDEQGL